MGIESCWEEHLKKNGPFAGTDEERLSDFQDDDR